MGDEIIRALDSVDVRIAAGEFVAIVGPSGSGKSTLANIVGGLDRPDSGEVLIEGRDLASLNDRELSAYRNRRVGFVFQAFNLHPGYTALENVGLPLLFAGVGARARKRRAEEVLRAVDLGDRMGHRPGQLSGGQRQRVSIARALANDPEILIADEPTGNVDSRKSAEIMHLLRDLNQQQGLTLIVITHDAAIASQADRVLAMRDGQIEEPEETGEFVADVVRTQRKRVG